MKPEETFKMMDGIDEKYIEEADKDRIDGEPAHEENASSAEKSAADKSENAMSAKQNGQHAGTPAKKTRTQRIFTWASLAAAIAVIVIVGFVMPYINDSRHSAALHAKAAEISKASLNFGADMPVILNVTGDRVVMYDYIGVWVYDMEKRKLTGFCDLQELDMTQLQGCPAVMIHSTKDGRYIAIYWSQDDGEDKPDTDQPMYIYDTVKDEYKKVRNFDGYDFSSKNSLKSSQNKNLSDYSDTYELSDKSYLYYIIDDNGSMNMGAWTYGDLILIHEKDGKKSEYRMFEGE